MPTGLWYCLHCCQGWSLAVHLLTEGRVGYRGPSRSWDGVSRGPAVLPLELTSRVATYIVPHLVFCDIVTLFKMFCDLKALRNANYNSVWAVLSLPAVFPAPNPHPASPPHL